MAIVRLKKMTLSGLIREKPSVLAQLQQLGAVHLIEFNQQTPNKQPPESQQNDDVLAALKYLNQCPRKRPQLDYAEDFNLEQVVRRVLNIRDQVRRLSEQRESIQQTIKQLEPWGDFHFPPLDKLAGFRFWFYPVPRHLLKKISPDLIWQIVYEDNIFCYVVVLSKQEPPARAMPVARSHTGSVPLSVLRRKALQITLQLEDLQAQRESLTRWITLISLSLLRYQDQLDLHQAMLMTLDDEDLFILQAWLPVMAERSFLDFANERQLAVLFEEPEEREKPPTLLKNPELVAAGEDLIRFYQIPGYREWDPSALVFFSFAFFFAMILSDAGYAILLSLVLLFKWQTLGKTEKGRRIRNLASVLILCSIIWGVLTGSYFGVSVEFSPTLMTLAILDLSDFEQMMRLSIGVGVLHLMLANLIRAWQRRNHTTALASLGWALVAASGYWTWLNMENGSDELLQFSYSGLGVGMVLIFLFSSSLQVTQGKDIPWWLLDGLKSLAGVSRIFGDALSYLRLFALGLASASLALTFNQLAQNVYHSLPGIGLFLGLVIILLGHLLNLLLCLMSGVVHGLRLNFIEFFHWSLSDEGYPFTAFACREEIEHG
jgi:V/A-type H+-transporting ATPase subunit I